MLCSICKKNMAVIFINKLDKEGKQTNETTGLCIECAKKQGIDPLANIMKEMTNMSEEDLENMSSQFDSMLNGFNTSNFDTDDEDNENENTGGFNIPNIFSNFMPRKQKNGNTKNEKEEKNNDKKTTNKKK